MAASIRRTRILPPRTAEPTPIETFLAPLAALARKAPEIEALVFWGGAGGWDDTPSEVLEAEEIAFYAEGLLIEGFRMVWVIAAAGKATAPADHIRLYLWQDDAPAPPPLPAGLSEKARAEWTGTP